MARLDSEIRETLTADFKKTYKYIENANYSSGALWKEIYENLPFEIPGQICLALARSQRCNIMETVIVRNPRALKVILDQIKENLKSLSKRLYSADYQARLHQGNLTQFVMFELESRDWLQDLTKKNVCSLKDYDWLKGLRYQCEDISKDLHVKQFLYKLPYGFEYLGFDYGSPTGIFPEAIFHNIWVASASKLGFLTHSDDMQYQKEAFRTYSNALGYRMFNVRCTRFVNPKVLSRALLGIAVSGCFAHLENVNLLDGESLDFLSQSITNLREIAGKKEGLNVSFLGRVIRIPGRIRFPVFVSTSKDFAQDDRNLGFLKTTMRSMELFSVEPTTYCQYLLFLSGYVRYFDLGKKLSRVFSDIPSLLSGIRFYDFSISAMRTIILMSTKKREHVENTGSNSNEEYLLRALFLYYLPRLHKSDKDPFISALANIFGIELSDDFISYGNSDRETLLIQMVQHELNVVVLGDAGVGKTTLLRAVAKDLGAEFRSVSAAAVGKDMVLGLYESSSYVPGILENISNSQHSLIFLVFDGPIESWCSEVIDAFLGDGCIVPNGKQLSLTSKLRVIWETQDFSNADPRIFGNFGMIHINTKIAWSDITKLWVENIKIQGSFHPLYRLTDKILAIFEHYTSEVYTVTKEMRKNLPIKTLVSSALSLFEAIYTENVTKMAEPNTLHSVIQYALLCTFCPIISGADQKGFEIHFADLVKQLDPYGPLTQFLETNPSCRLHRLELDISHMVWKLSLPGSTSWWETCAQYLIKAKIPVLLTGPIGSRKTTTLTKIKAQMEEDFLCYTESMLPGSNPRKIGEYFNRILVPDENGSRYIPANNKNLITFLDDVNIAQPSTGEDYCMWEFIRGVIGTGAYWANATSCRHIENIGMICSVDTNHKGQILVPKNLERHFTFISTGTLDDAVELVLHFVSTEIAGKLASRFKGDLSQCLLNITNVLKDLSIGLRAWSVSEATSAYSLFSVHDLERVFSGIMDCDSFGLWDHNKLISLFVHECQRVFRDRLPRDQGYHFDNLFNLSFGRHLPRRDTLFDEDFLIRVSRFINEICVEDESNSSPKVLKYTKDIIPVDKDTLEKIIIETSRKYSDKKRLYNYPTAALHFNRLHRILNLENYCRALLIGFPGIDYVLDMVMLVANYCNFPLRKYQFSSKKFSVSDWNSFIKRQIMDSTIYNHVVVANVIVTKDAVVPMLVWGDLHSICNHGRVDRLWSESEFEELLNKMLAELKRTDPEFDPGNDPRPLVMKGVFEKFKVRISSNLKIVICIDQRNTLCIQSTCNFFNPSV